MVSRSSTPYFARSSSPLLWYMASASSSMMVIILPKSPETLTFSPSAVASMLLVANSLAMTAADSGDFIFRVVVNSCPLYFSAAFIWAGM